MTSVISTSSSSRQSNVTPGLCPQTPHQSTTSTPQAPPQGLGAPPSRILVLFNNEDLRTIDNAALSSASTDSKRTHQGTLIPAILPCTTSSSSQQQQYVKGLSDEITKLGSTLIHLSDLNMVVTMCEKLNLQAVYMNRAMTKKGAYVQKQLENVLKNKSNKKSVDVYSFWSGNALFTPTKQHMHCHSKSTHNNPKCCSSKKESRTSFIDVYTDVLKQPIGEITNIVNAPETLPKLPVAATAFNTKLLDQQQAQSGVGSVQALKVLNNVLNDKFKETLGITKGMDAALVIKTYLDCGTLSVRMVAKRVVEVMGELKGRTFSELVWRTYVSFAANGAVGLTKACRSTAGYA